MSRILVVDDDPDFCEAMRVVLTSAGHTVETAINGQQAVISALQASPDLIILDVMMQGALDGLSAAHEIEESQVLHGIPIIMVFYFWYKWKHHTKLIPLKEIDLSRPAYKNEEE